MSTDADAPGLQDANAEAQTPPKRCFVVSEFGSSPEARGRTAQVLKHVVRKVLVPLGYKVVRADEIHAPGLITHQVIEHLLDAELVIADLTGNNPNVFYEIAVRHAVRKPIVHLITDGEEIPFDIRDVRTVFYALDDPDRLEAAQKELAEKVAAIEGSDEDATNPIAAVRHLRLLQASDSPETRDIGEVLSTVSDLRDEMRSLVQQSRAMPVLTSAAGFQSPQFGGTAVMQSPVQFSSQPYTYRRGTQVSLPDYPEVRFPSDPAMNQIDEVLDDAEGRELTTKEVADKVGLSVRSTGSKLKQMTAVSDDYVKSEKGWSKIPF